MLWFSKIPVSKVVRDLGWERESRFSVEVILSDSTETFGRGTLLCCFSEVPDSDKKYR